jgi:hypothetical protein
MTPHRRLFFVSAAVISLFIATADITNAQLRLPRPSPKASVSQTIGVTDVTISYHRPGVKGRKIWGDPPANAPQGEATLDDGRNRPADMPIVPYGRLWRTGANDATQFVVTDDVLINGQPLPAGSYSLHTIPGKDEWTVVFNGTANQWGSFSYDATKDLLRVKAKPASVTDSQEWMGFTIDPAADNSAIVNIRWEKVRVPFTVEVKDVAAATIKHARSAVESAKPDDWGIPFNAATYAKANKADADAAKWFEQSLKAAEEQLKAKETFQGLQRKSSSLLALGRRDEAIAAAERAVVVGKAEKANTAALEKRIADMKAGKL